METHVPLQIRVSQPARLVISTVEAYSRRVKAMGMLGVLSISEHKQGMSLIHHIQTRERWP